MHKGLNQHILAGVNVFREVHQVLHVGEIPIETLQVGTLETEVSLVNQHFHEVINSKGHLQMGERG